MTKPQIFEKPMGFRDFPYLLAEKKRLVEDRVRQQFVKWGYREVYTPTLEFFDTVGQASEIPDSRMFKLMDRDGNILVLRPDQTAPIARLVTSVLKREPLPLRLFYHGNVFRAQEKEAGRSSELFQSGVELVGQSCPEADTEVIALSIEALRACEIHFPIIALSHVGLLEGFLRERIDHKAAISKLKQTLGLRDLVAFRQILACLDLSSADRQEILAITRSGLEHDQWKSLMKLARTEPVHDAFVYLERVWNNLEASGCTQLVKVDLSLVGSLDYYTGVYFEGYADGQGFPLVSGGRYDQLYQEFGVDLPATGFALKTDRLLEASPLKPEFPVRLALFYEPHLQKKAWKKAKSLRDDGWIVIMQPMEEGQIRKDLPVDDVLVIADEGGTSLC
ncbi:ATP phosphoribosyltransferase regulatory subunit [Thermoactinomyces mirandus]|uniref:ATP phosphoribosyltransferase regulatory subunit n=1 Tax=Thermoactinomyces mirandus TaxID=2756294 RepID=A0A7W1XU21_9BACL|nr:ATP phosphoribosyltransferase regulatory subunit [Thermoactinomyces mirandus]MBA4603225.1 ATP phosphoribosyltransferase regulatory subunit [Thermoactinomyces mirandus]